MMCVSALAGGEGGLEWVRRQAGPAAEPQPVRLSRGAAVDALLGCAEACTRFADVRLHSVDAVEGLGAVRVVLDCADTCADTVRALIRPGGDTTLLAALLSTCATACRTAAARADQRCADACRAAVRACLSLRTRH